jgi:hypothetical protein
MVTVTTIKVDDDCFRCFRTGYSRTRRLSRDRMTVRHTTAISVMVSFCLTGKPSTQLFFHKHSESFSSSPVLNNLNGTLFYDRTCMAFSSVHFIQLAHHCSVLTVFRTNFK